MRRLASLLVTTTLLTVIPFGAAHAVTLQEALVAAYKNNPSLKSEREALKAVDERAYQAFSEWLPSVSASYSTSIGDETREYTDYVPETSPSNPNPSPGVKASGHTATKQLQVSQPIFNGGRTIAAMGLAEHQIESARASLKRTEQATLLDAVSSYMDVVRDQEVLQLTVNNEEVLEKHLDATKERFRLGEVTRTDVAQAKARLSQAKSERAQAEGNLEKSRAAYKRVTVEDANAATMPSVPSDIPTDVADIRTQALTANPALIIANYDYLAAKENVKVVRAELLPEVSLLGRMREDEVIGAVGSGLGDYESQSVTLNVTIPLFENGGSVYSRVRQAKRGVAERENDKHNIANAVEEFATQVWHDYKVARSTIRSASDAVDAAQVALEGVIQEAQVGSRTTLDVLDAEQELFAAKVDKVRAQRDEIVAAYNIKLAVGHMTAAHLKLPVNIYNEKENYDNVKFQIVGY